MLKYRLNVIVLFIGVILPATTGWGAGDPFDPWKFGHQPAAETTARQGKETASLPARMAVGALNFFSEHISRVDGDRCPMYPTCASYSRQVVRKHGFFIGIVMTADRLIHENTEMQYAPLVKVGDSIRYFDPVSENDFWWHKRKVLTNNKQLLD